MKLKTPNKTKSVRSYTITKQVTASDIADAIKREKDFPICEIVERLSPSVGDNSAVSAIGFSYGSEEND
jgi:hypothetical protein